jgi:hypothetical protein
LTDKQAPRPKVAPLHLSAIVLLALVAWVHPALSATGSDARCDQRIDALPMSTAGDGKLAIEVLDHGANAALAGNDIPLEAAVASPALESPDRPSEPRIDVMLRRISDDARLPQSRLSEPDEVEVVGAPLAVGRTKAIEKPATALDTNQTDVAAELPGFSADELLRYRQQMFRKDI